MVRLTEDWVGSEMLINLSITGYPNRIDVRPQGPRETPNFNKKQEYL